ncbi:MAG: hypothetical protein B6244_09700 [Candidatus Cloacimonetes bacterium 4572_55]|nr:MAG: hypothetical protein B6244_09700 [Candidatus Cloacimonetes bacterium 4572_55]
MKNLIPRFIQQNYQANIMSGAFQAVSMFVDISGFTQTTEALIRSGKEEGAEILSDIMRFYFTPTVLSVYGHKGFIVGFAGDAFTALFPYGPDPKGFRKPLGSHALAAAHEINRFFADNPVYHSKYGDFEFDVKVGLAMGHVEWGIVGRETRKTFYFRGTAIDGCAQAEHQAIKGEVWAAADLIKTLRVSKTLKVWEKGNFFRIDGVKSGTFPKPVGFESWEIDPEAIGIFYGDEVVQFQRAEFRKISPLFLAFENVTDLDEFATMILDELRTYGGTISRLDFGDKGGNVLAFFGAPVAYENIEERVLQFILAIRQRLTELENMSNVKLRAGVTTGVSYCGFNGSDLRSEFTCLGNAVNQSARFMMKADWGQILVDAEITQNKQFNFTHLGDFVFKGRGTTIPTYKLLGKKSAIEAFYKGEMVGRDKELAQLQQHIEPIFDSKFGGVVYVDGIAGMGKSRLVNELRENITKRHKITWLYLPCEEILRKSFNPVVYFFNEYFNQSDENSPAENKSAFERKLNNLIDKTSNVEIRKELIRTKSILGAMINLYWKGSLYEQLDAKGRYENTLYAIKNLIKAKSLIQPVIVELEDGHWIDADSKKVLEVLTRNVTGFPFVIISPCRYLDDGSEFRFGLTDVIENQVKLENLGKEAAGALILENLQEISSLPDQTLNFIFDKSQGNPFYIEQITLYLQENELFDADFNLVSNAFKIPDGITSIIIARVDRLSQQVKDVIKAAAVIGREFEIRILSAVLHTDVQTQIEIAKDGQIWSELSELQYIFKHALLKDAVYDMQIRARLRELHCLTAEVIEKLYEDDLSVHYGDLAFHYEKAEVNDKAMEYLEKAGDYAREHYQNQQALDFYDRLLDFPNLENLKNLRITILLKKGMILKFIGKWDECQNLGEEALSLAEEIVDKNRIAAANLVLGALLYDKGNHEQAMTCFDISLEISQELDDKLVIAQSIGMIGLVCYRKGDYAEAMDCFEKELKISRELGNKQNISTVVGNIGMIYKNKGEYTEAMECYEKSLKISRELGDKKGIARAVGNMGLVYASKGDYAAAMDCFEKKLKIAEELGNKKSISTVVGNIGIVYQEKGDDAAAMRCYEKKLKIAEELGDKEGISIAIGNMGVVYDSKGDYAAAMDCYDKMLKIAEELGDKERIFIAVGNMGDVCVKKGDYAAAMDCYEKAIVGHREIAFKFGLTYWLGGKARCLFENGLFSEAKKFADECVELSAEISKRDTFFYGNKLSAKIDFASGHQKKAVAMLSEMLAGSEEKSEIADLNYELRIMNGELGNTEQADKHRQAALERYQKLYEKTPKFEYKKRIEELTTTNNGD